MAEEPTTKENLPPGAEIDSDGLWSQVLNRAQGATRRAALFLDRDGVVVEEVHYLHRPADVSLIDGAAGMTSFGEDKRGELYVTLPMGVYRLVAQ